MGKQRKQVPKTGGEKEAREQYIALKLEFDYLLVSLYEALQAGNNEYRLFLLDELYDLQTAIELIELKYPQFAKLNVHM